MLQRLKLKRPLEDYNKTWLGAIALGVIVAIVAVVLLIGTLDLGKTEYTAEFAQAATISSGDQVTIAGISVGTVNRLELAGDHVNVRFSIRKDVHLGSDTKAAIKLTTLLGSRYVQVSPGGTGDLRRYTIPLANTSVPYDLQKTLADATTTFVQVDADRIADSFTTLSHNLDGVPDALPEALTNLQSLSAVISGRRDQIGSLLSSTDTLTTLIRNQKADIGSLVVQGRDLLAEITSRRDALQRLLANTAALVDTLHTVLNDEPGVNEMLASIRDLSRMIAQHDGLLRNILQAAPLPIRNLANATGSSTAVDLTLPAGVLIDSWMCAISGRAQQFGLVEYFQDCQ
jgi:phospholipid/cholesterol/gamma-HCH transport system substrate-binding protein